MVNSLTHTRSAFTSFQCFASSKMSINSRVSDSREQNQKQWTDTSVPKLVAKESWVCCTT